MRRLASTVQYAESRRAMNGANAAKSTATTQLGSFPRTDILGVLSGVARCGRMGSRVRSLFVAALSLFILLPRARSANAAPRYDVRAAIGADGERIVIDEVVTDDAWDVTTRAVTLWLYADRMRAVPPSFDEFTAERLFVGNVSRGGFEALRLAFDGCPDRVLPPADDQSVDPVQGRSVDVAPCPEATLPLRLRVKGTLRLARRYGTLGRARDGTQLGDPWYPLVAPRASPTPPRGAHHVRVTTTERKTIVAPSGVLQGESATVDVDDATHAPVMVLDGAHVATEVIRGVQVTFVTGRAPVPRFGDAGDTSGPPDPFDPDAARAIIGATEHAIDFARRLGMVASAVPAPRAIASRMVVVEIEERQRISVALPGMLAVSDRAFRLLPIGEVRRFHELAIRRRAFAVLLEPHDRALEAEADLPFIADVDGSLLTDLSAESESDRKKTPADLIGFAGFHPAIDQLLYAPQVAFRSAYFHDIDAADPDRDGADRAHNPWPFGHLVLEKLRDRLGPERFAKAAFAHLVDGVPWRTAAERAYGASLAEFFATWVGPHRSVAYRLGAIASERDGDGFSHRIAVERRGETWIREPVTVDVRDASGAHVRAVWDAAGASGEVVAHTRGELADVVLDPDGRLTEDPALSDNHPRWDNSLEHPFRPPIFNSFATNLSGSQALPDASLDFVLRRRYEVREGYGLRVSSTARGIGGSVRYIRGLGPLRDLNSTQRTASVGLSALRSSSGFAGSTVPVTDAGITFGYGYDTRRQIYDPAVGRSLSAAIFVGADREDRDCADRGCTHAAASVSVRAQQLFWPNVENVLAITAGAAAAKCPALVQSLVSLAGRQLLRGYEADELLGCATAYAIFEERWSPLRGLYVNAADLAWGRRLEIVPFAAGGMLSSRDTVADIYKRAYFDVGLGLRAMYDYAGVQPGVIAVDVAYPVSRTADERCRLHDAAGRCTAYRQPIGLWISFEQTF